MAIGNPPLSGSRRRYRLLLGLALLALFLPFSAWIATQEWLSADELIQLSENAFDKDELGLAQIFVNRLLALDPDSMQGKYMQSMLRQIEGNSQEQLRLLKEIPDDGSNLAVKARCAEGDVYLFKLRQLEHAEIAFRRAYGQQPEMMTACNRLAYLLGLQSRNWEALRYRLLGVQSGTFSAAEMFLISLGDRAMDDPDEIYKYVENAGQEPAAQLAWGRVLAENGDTAGAIRRFKSALTSPDHAPEALSRWGIARLQAEGANQNSEWDQAAKAETDHPGIWFVRGILAGERQDPKAEARCYWEALLRDPERSSANYRLGQILIRLGRISDAQPFLQRAALLDAYERAATLGFRAGDPYHLQLARDAAHDCGLIVEEWGWSRLQLANPDDRFVVMRADEIPKLGAAKLVTRSDPSKNPAKQIDLSDWPWSASPASVSPVQPIAAPRIHRSTIRFEETARAAGIDFHYMNGGEPAEGIKFMYEVTGGGVAVIDFDRDEWPDLYFPQGGNWNAGTQRQERDRLLRNQGDGTFADVTEGAGIDEREFSIGTSVGDIDGDGFADIFVINSGQDSLLLNQGDGTFKDATRQAGLLDQDYGSSAAIADFSGDGLADIYVVNYLAGSDLWERVCGGTDGIQRSCLPQSFPGAVDRLLINQGDGQFLDQTPDAGMAAFQSKGLGIIAARFDPRDRLGIYLANDVGPNQLLLNKAEGNGGHVHFIDTAVPAGVALSFDGRSQSGMGVTAGDIDGNGLLDLFVTNFEDETNTLYLQRESLQFEDATIPCGLADPDLGLVGWGTQMIDADQDGWLDIAFTNGHVNNLTDRSKPYRMKPAFFRNRGEGRMLLVDPNVLGRYFQQDYLGRGMACLDWNQDGLDDLLVTHLDAPAALLTNRSEGAGHGVRIYLTGTRCERDAIGTIVTVVSDDRHLVRQLTAGDGNQSTNERCLNFGLGTQSTISRMTIDWPDGSTQEFRNVEVDRAYRVIEGNSVPIELRHWE